MNLVDQMEGRTGGGQGFSIFDAARATAHKTEEQKIRDFNRAVNGEAVGESQDDAAMLAAAGADEPEIEETEGAPEGGVLGQGMDSDGADQDLDIARTALAADGWSLSEIQSLPRAAVMKMAERVQRERSPQTPSNQPETVAATGIDLEGLERELESEVGKKATKTLMERLVRPLVSQTNAVASQNAQQRVEAVVSQNLKLYPELKGEVARRAVVDAAVRGARQGESDAVAFRRALVALYGDRKAEARQQTQYQMTQPGRPSARPSKPTRDQANIAALHTWEKTGSRDAALNTKKRLGH
jgi:hypothetical protein